MHFNRLITACENMQEHHHYYHVRSVDKHSTNTQSNTLKVGDTCFTYTWTIGPFRQTIKCGFHPMQHMQNATQRMQPNAAQATTLHFGRCVHCVLFLCSLCFLHSLRCLTLITSIKGAQVFNTITLHCSDRCQITSKTARLLIWHKAHMTFHNFMCDSVDYWSCKLKCNSSSCVRPFLGSMVDQPQYGGTTTVWWTNYSMMAQR